MRNDGCLGNGRATATFDKALEKTNTQVGEAAESDHTGVPLE
jgi:hypothetical protein